MTPYNPPNRTPRQVFDWALDIARIADEAGYTDYMIGEHYTLGWENIPMPEAVIAACAQTTAQDKRLVGRNPAADDQKYPFAGQHSHTSAHLARRKL